MKNVLIVDDDESTRFVLSRALEDIGYRVVAADDGAEVSGLVASQRFDLLVLDLYMPGMNGFEVLRQIRRRPASVPATATNSAVRVLVVSGECYAASVANAKALGADGYLIKPIDVEAFQISVRTLLEHPSGSPGKRTSRHPVSKDARWPD